MRALLLDYRLRKLALRALPEPRLEAPDEVLVAIREVGVCGTDTKLAHFEIGQPPPGADHLILGHEALGQVLETGPAVQGLNPGDWVVPQIRRPCDPPCLACARNRRDLCLSGHYTERGIWRRHGYFAELAVDRERDLVRVPAALAPWAVLIEPLSVVEKAVERALQFRQWPPANALVVGAGAIGLLAALCLQARGYPVALCSLEPPDHPRARLAQAAGIDYLEAPARRQADLVIEAAGTPAALRYALDCLAPLGVLAIAGGAADTVEFRSLDLLIRNQILFGSVNASPEAFRLALEDLRRFDPAILSNLLDRRPFEDLPATILTPSSPAGKPVHRLAG